MENSARSPVAMCIFAACLIIWASSHLASYWLPTGLFLGIATVWLGSKATVPTDEEITAINNAMKPIVNWVLIPAQLLFFALIWLTLRATYPDMDPSGEMGATLLGENGLWENAQLLFLLFGIIFYLKYFLHHRPASLRGRWMGVAVFSLLLLFIAGEESNWGQIWLHFETPKILEIRNIEGEANLHELSFSGISLESWAGFVVHLLLLLYGIILPVCAYTISNVQALLDKIHCPVPHVSVALLAVIALGIHNEWVISSLLQLPSPAFVWDASELRETILYFMLMVGAMYSTRRWRIAGRYTRPIQT